MNADDFATHILRSESLAEKLWRPPPLIVKADGKKLSAPTLPARSAALRPTNERNRKVKKSWLSGANLTSKDERIELLHAFANHELLALELFAWVLLKFPDAPLAFKKGVSGIMLDEQRHCAMYAKRLEELGSFFGERPVNDFIWRTISQAETLSHFTAAMSLTFEQANLDFAAHYAQLFAAAGDEASAGILQLVFNEEIQHVKHGLHWFETWRPDRVETFDYHESSLQYPLTMARAQGINFQQDARKKAGLPASYIDRLRTHAASKGRPPRVFFFNPCYELENVMLTSSFSPTASVRELESDLANLLMFLAHKDDVVLVNKRPSDAFLLQLSEQGFNSCDFIEMNAEKIDANKVSQRHLRLSKLEPWGWSPRSRQTLAPLVPLLPGDEQKRLAALREKTGADGRPQWLGKHYAHKVRSTLPWPNDVVAEQIMLVRREDDLIGALTTIYAKTSGPDTWVAKAPLGASGNQHLRFSRRKPLEENPYGWMKNILQSQGSLIFEPWVEKFADLSAIGVVDHQGQAQVWGITRFLTDEKGHYTGHQLGHPLAGLSTNVVRSVHQPLADGSGHKSMLERLQVTATFVGHELAREGYRGPYGIDAFIYHSESSGQTTVSIQTLVEINTRWTMGHIAHQIQRHLGTSYSGVWRHLMRPALKTEGFTSFTAFAAEMQHRYGERFVPTNDPGQAVQCLTYLLRD